MARLNRWRRWAGPADRGSTPTEYALILGLIALVIVGAVAALGQDLAALFNTPIAGL